MKMISSIVHVLPYQIRAKLWGIKKEIEVAYARHTSGIRVMSSQHTIEYIIANRCCVSRFGDGEFGMILGEHNIGFQQYDNGLSKKLGEVLGNRRMNLLVCVPRYLFYEKELCGFGYDFWHAWNKNNLVVTLKLLKRKANTKVFGDTQISRPYMDRQDRVFAGEIFAGLKRIWEDRDVIIIEGEDTRLGFGNDLLADAKSIKRILAPSKNAFSVYDRLLSFVDSIYNDELILIALGPTATCLAYDFAKKGYWAIDIGHIDIEYEWYLRGSSTKETIEGKYVNEVEGGDVCGVCDDKMYLESICCRIKEN